MSVEVAVRRSVALLFLLCASSSFGQKYVGSSADSTSVESADVGEIDDLTLVTSDGHSIKAPKISAQVAFDRPIFSPDARRVIWAALVPFSGTSYPIPTALVIFRGNKIERVIREDQCIFQVMFAEHGSAIAYYTSALHFDLGKTAHLRRLSDGKEIGRYEIPGGAPDTINEEKDAALKSAPQWVRDINRIDL